MPFSPSYIPSKDSGLMFSNLLIRAYVRAGTLTKLTSLMKSGNPSFISLLAGTSLRSAS